MPDIHTNLRLKQVKPIHKNKYFVFAENFSKFLRFREICPIQTKSDFDFVYINSIQSLRGVEIKTDDFVEFLPNYRIAESMTHAEVLVFLQSRTR